MRTQTYKNPNSALCLSTTHADIRGVEVSSMNSEPYHQMKVQAHLFATLSLHCRKEFLVLIGCKAGWVLGLIWM